MHGARMSYACFSWAAPRALSTIYERWFCLAGESRVLAQPRTRLSFARSSPAGVDPISRSLMGAKRVERARTRIKFLVKSVQENAR